jgi:hypothetical protein
MPTKKRDLRVASIGYKFNCSGVQDISFSSNRTLLGQDVVLLDIASLPYSYSLGYGSSRYRGKLSLDDNETTRIVDDISRRRRELKTLLELGGTLVLFLPAPDSWYVDTGQRQHSGTGRNRHTTIMVSEMKLLSVLPFNLRTEAAETRELELRIGEPFATFWRACDYRFQTSAILKEPFGETTLVIKGTESVAGSIARVERGSVIVLPEGLLYPAKNGEEDEEEDDGQEEEGTDGKSEPHPWDVELLDALFDLVRALRSESGDFEQPEWSREYLLPGEEEAAGEVRKASSRLAEAQKELDDAQRLLALREQRKTLLTGTGRALEALVEEALGALGFEVEEGRPGRTDRVAHLGKQTAVLEVKGLAKSAGEKDAAQLEKWVNEHFIEQGEMAKGILVTNGWRDRPPEKRNQPVFPDQMLKYAQARGHCLISSMQLLGAWLDADEHPKKAKAIANSILKCVGRYPDYADWSQFVTRDQQTVKEIDAAGVDDAALGGADK